MERLNDVGIAAAMNAFHKGPPGVVRRVAQNDSTPPEYVPIPTTYNDERAAISDAIRAYVECVEDMELDVGSRRRLEGLDNKEMGKVLAVLLGVLDDRGIDLRSFLPQLAGAVLTDPEISQMLESRS